MNARKPQLHEDYKNAIENLCADLALLDEKVADPQWWPTIKTVTSTEPLTETWCTAVHQVHKMAQDAGITGGLGLTTPMGNDWPRRKPPHIYGWVCPERVCTRVELPSGESGEPKPDMECHLFERAMRFVKG
jgi:hypothetical protein